MLYAKMLEEEVKPMRLIDVVLEVERILKENNITWRYVSSRNTRTFILEDGTNTVITMRFDSFLETYFIHATKPIEGRAELQSNYWIVYDVMSVNDIVEEIIGTL